MRKRVSFNRASQGADLVADLTSSIVGIPDARALGILVGVSSIHGLYVLMTGTPVAAIGIIETRA